MNTNNSNYNILVLTDFSEAATIALRNASKLAKLVNGKLQAYYVQPLQKFAEEENQLSLGRNLRESYTQTLVKGQKLMKTIAEDEGIETFFSTESGNVKNCILNKLKNTNPDLVIIGKRTSNPLKLIGDRVTQFLIDECHTSILIGGKNKELHSFSDLSLGFYGKTIEKDSVKIIESLLQKPHSVKYFGIRSLMSKDIVDEVDTEKENTFMFPQQGMKAIEALTSYVVHAKTDLFCIPMQNSAGLQPVKEMVKRLNIPVLIYR